jgi:four helix bundle protein
VSETPKSKREVEKGQNTELTIITKLHDMIKYAYPALAQYPKSEKFAIVADIKHCMDMVMERAIEASKKYYKKTTLQDMDVELMKLRHYLRLSHELGFLPPKKYEIWSGMVVEIGRMLGGWIKQNAAAEEERAKTNKTGNNKK